MNTLFTRKQMHKIANAIHRIVIGGDAGARTMQFAKNLTVSIAGGLGAFALLFVANVVVARVLGPEEYGLYSVFFSVAQIVSLLYVLELDVSALYFLSEKKENKKGLMSSILLMFGINIIVFSLLAESVFHFFHFVQMSQVVFLYALGFAVVFSTKRMMDAFLRADEKFVWQAILRLGEGIVAVIFLVIFMWGMQNRSFASYALALTIAGGVFTVAGGIVTRRMLTVKAWDVEKMNTVFHYNAFGLINAMVNGVIKNADTLIIAAVLGVKTAGVYAVYFTAIVVIGARITQLFVSVFFPSVRMHADRIQSVIAKIDRMCIRTFLPIVLFSGIGIACIVVLYGNGYPFVWLWILLGGVYMGVHFFASLYGWILSSISQTGYKRYNLSFVFGLIAYASIICVAYVTQAVTITVFLVALITYRTVCGAIAFYHLRKNIAYGQRVV
jgi:O-antigen/teichoic acid export membrane protein